MPILTYPRLDLDPAPETTAFRAIDQVLRNDQVLQRVVNKQGIFSWLGDPMDDAEPTLSVCPWLRLTPMAGDADWETETQHKFPLMVGIELAVGGTNVDQLANFWNAVRSALFPQDGTARSAIRAQIAAAGITKGRFIKPAIGVKQDAAGNKMLMAGGMLELLLFVTT